MTPAPTKPRRKPPALPSEKVIAVYELPYPPSVNHYWSYGRGRMFISKAGRIYREEVCAAVIQQKRVRFGDDKLEVFLQVWHPDHRERDLDNIEKALFDSLAHAGVYNRDHQIWKKSSVRMGVKKGGAVHVIIRNDTVGAASGQEAG